MQCRPKNGYPRNMINDDYLSPANHPYFRYGAEPQQFAYMFNAGAGGNMQSTKAAASLGALGSASLLESGYGDPNFATFPAFHRTQLHRTHRGMGDWPLVRPSGPEPLDPNATHGLGMLSDNERNLLLLLAAGGLGWYLWKRMGKAGPRGSRRLARSTRRLVRSNPVNAAAGWEVMAGKGRRREYAGSFTSKAEAHRYAVSLRRQGYGARVRRAR